MHIGHRRSLQGIASGMPVYPYMQKGAGSLPLVDSVYATASVTMEFFCTSIPFHPERKTVCREVMVGAAPPRTGSFRGGPQGALPGGGGVRR